MKGSEPSPPPFILLFTFDDFIVPLNSNYAYSHQTIQTKHQWHLFLPYETRKNKKVQKTAIYNTRYKN
jgi:hypothetical protein